MNSGYLSLPRHKNLIHVIRQGKNRGEIRVYEYGYEYGNSTRTESRVLGHVDLLERDRNATGMTDAATHIAEPSLTLIGYYAPTSDSRRSGRR